MMYYFLYNLFAEASACVCASVLEYVCRMFFVCLGAFVDQCMYGRLLSAGVSLVSGEGSF